MRGIVKLWWLPVSVLVLGGGGYLLLGGAGHGASTPKSAAAREVQPVAVTVAPLTRRAVRRTVEVVGSFQGYEEVSLAPKVDGRVTHILHEVGDVVAPGAELMRIDDTDYQLAVAEAERGLDLELTRVGLDRLKAEEREKLLVARTMTALLAFDDLPAVARAKAQEDLAQQLQERSRRLRLGGAVGAEEMDKVRSELRLAQAAREQALMDAKAALAAARFRHAALQTALQKLADTRLVVPPCSSKRLPPGQSKPIQYVVAKRMVAEGDMVKTSPPTTVFKLVIDTTLKLMGQVPERHLGEVAVDQPVSISVEAYPEIFKGTIARIDPTVDRASRTFMVEITVPNGEGKLKAGGFAKASILTRPEDQAATVPEEAVVRFAGVTKVFVVKDERALGIAVRTGERLEVGKGERWIEIIGPVPPGTPIVTTGHSQLADGTPVRVR